MDVISLLNKETLSKDDIVLLLSLTDKNDINLLYKKADEVREKFCGYEVHLRGIVEFSNHCKRDCLYCGLRKSNSVINRYRMSEDEIVYAVKNIYDEGIQTVVLQSGEDFAYTTETITRIISTIKNEFDLAITLSLGERNFEEYVEWKRAGADRYLLKHETAKPSLYFKARGNQNIGERILHLRMLISFGYQVGSGNIIGLPGQTLEDIAEDIFLCEELNCDMTSFSPFIPSPDTPYAEVPRASLEMTLKTTAVARIVLKDVHIPSTTALGSLIDGGREMGLLAGANVVMPNFTPNPYRQDYRIYDGKICITEEPVSCSGCLQVKIEAMGRKVGKGKGHSLKLIENYITPS